MLEDLGTSDVAEDGNAAVKKYKEKSGKVSIIFMDLNMPNCDGF